MNTQKGIATRKRNARNRKLFRAYAWFLAYGFVSIITVYVCGAWYATSYNAIVETTKVEPVNATVYEQETAEDIIGTIGGEYGAVMVKLARCESSLNQYATHANRNGSVDRGIFQINSIHKDISDECAFDTTCASKWTLDKLTNGQGHIWVCWKQL